MIDLRSFFGKILLIIITGLACSSNTDNSSGTDGDFSHTQSVGATANGFLAADDFNSLVIEVDYVQGFKPTQTSLDGLKSFLESRLNKPGGITISLDDEITSPGGSPYTAQETFDLEKEHRNTYTQGKTLAAYFLVLDGQFEQENVLGFAYFNTSMALLGGTIANNSGGLSQPSRATVETAVLNHEFGHILGLVDNGSPAIQDHIDEANGAHCDVESCLMYYAVRTSDFVGTLMGGSVPELDAQCIQDLQANGGK